MHVSATRLPEVLLIQTRLFRDDRGAFMEIWRAQGYEEAGIEAPLVQDNVSWSKRNVLRGLHLQHPNAQGKLVGPLTGSIWDVAVDLRAGSPSFGEWCAEELSAGTQLYIPPGFAHGFLVLSEEATVMYKCTEYYDPAAELTVLWNDPSIAIAWPAPEPILSARDAAGLRISDLPLHTLPRYPG